MIRAGLFQSHGPKCHCGGKRGQVIEIECVSCDGVDDDCDDCGGVGRIPVTSCVFSETASIADIVPMFELYLDRGLAPIAGGVLDQSAWFVNAAVFYQSQRNRATQ